MPVAAGPDPAAARRLAARWLTVYCTRMGPIYPRMLRERFGYADEVDALLAANADGDEPILPTAARRLAEDVLVMAAHDELDDAAAAWAEAGPEHLDLVLPFGVEATELDAILAAAAPVARAAATFGGGGPVGKAGLSDPG